ncbi:hypothetical protein EH223_18910 [candidate division KSB1 bacterium]|nr:hypothetical protein [candidate division KSB1 bacterium]RQW00374.1 MAG: hypothetical protein EH223_18910 [candidate division KSB1 bacterium]
MSLRDELRKTRQELDDARFQYRQKVNELEKVIISSRKELTDSKDEYTGKYKTADDQIKKYWELFDSNLENKNKLIPNSKTKLDSIPMPEENSPVLLFPVRIETKFEDNQEKLLIRIFPDDIALSTHKQELNDEEIRDGALFWNAFQEINQVENKETNLKAWQTLYDKYGPERGAYIAEKYKQYIRSSKSDRSEEMEPFNEWSDPPHSFVLPDYWVVMAMDSTTQDEPVLLGISKAIPDDLPAGPSTQIVDDEDKLFFDEGSKWLKDFKEAKNKGMALEIEHDRLEQVNKIEKLFVFGFKGLADLDDNSDKSRELLARLITEHCYTEGFQFLTPGTPTNNMADEKTSFSLWGQSLEDSFALYFPENSDEQPENSSALAMFRNALALTEENELPPLSNAAFTEAEHLRDVGKALWPGTIGGFLQHRLRATNNEVIKFKAISFESKNSIQIKKSTDNVKYFAGIKHGDIIEFQISTSSSKLEHEIKLFIATDARSSSVNITYEDDDIVDIPINAKSDNETDWKEYISKKRRLGKKNSKPFRLRFEISGESFFSLKLVYLKCEFNYQNQYNKTLSPEDNPAIISGIKSTPPKKDSYIGRIRHNDWVEYKINSKKSDLQPSIANTGWYEASFYVASELDLKTETDSAKIELHQDDRYLGHVMIDMSMLKKPSKPSEWLAVKTRVYLIKATKPGKIKLVFKGKSGFLFTLAHFQLRLLSILEETNLHIEAENCTLNLSGLPIIPTIDHSDCKCLNVIFPKSMVRYSGTFLKAGCYNLQIRLGFNKVKNTGKIYLKDSLDFNPEGIGELSFKGDTGSNWQTFETQINLDEDIENLFLLFDLSPEDENNAEISILVNWIKFTYIPLHDSNNSNNDYSLQKHLISGDNFIITWEPTEEDDIDQGKNVTFIQDEKKGNFVRFSETINELLIPIQIPFIGTFELAYCIYSNSPTVASLKIANPGPPPVHIKASRFGKTHTSDWAINTTRLEISEKLDSVLVKIGDIPHEKYVDLKWIQLKKVCPTDWLGTYNIINQNARQFYLDHVLPLKQLPTIQADANPYGIYPACDRQAFDSRYPHFFPTDIEELVWQKANELRDILQKRISNIPAVPNQDEDSDMDENFINMLLTKSESIEFSVKDVNANNTKSANELLDTTDIETGPALTESSRTKSLLAPDDLSASEDPETYVHNYLNELVDLFTLVEQEETESENNSTTTIFNFTTAELARFVIDSNTLAVFSLLLRQGLLRETIDIATLLYKAFYVDERDPVTIQSSGVTNGEEEFDILALLTNVDNKFPCHLIIGEERTSFLKAVGYKLYVDHENYDNIPDPRLAALIEQKVSNLKDQIQAIKNLIGLPLSDLERYVGQVLDLGSHRIDAWITAFHYKKLWEMRQGEDEKEVVPKLCLGAFGYLENVQANNADESINAGFVHAPSFNQATTAAILRNGFYQHAMKRNEDDNEDFAIDLSSERVKKALWLLEGIRQGQSLSALLGYRFERMLREAYIETNHELELAQYIYDFRILFPLDEKLPPDDEETQNPDDNVREKIAAQNVVDGRKLLNEYEENDKTLKTWPQDLLKDEHEGEKKYIKEHVLNRLAEILDSLADLGIAEAVHQSIQGRFDRAEAILKTVSAGNYPPEVEVIKTPRSGIRFTHKVCVFLPEPGSQQASSSENGWAVTPRSLIAPQLESWIAQMLGNAGDIKCRYRFEGAEVYDEEIVISELGLSALDFLILAESPLYEKKNTFDQYIENFLGFKNLSEGGNESHKKVEFEHSLLKNSGSETVSNDTQNLAARFQLAATISTLLTKSRPLDIRDCLRPEDLDLSDETYGSNKESETRYIDVGFSKNDVQAFKEQIRDQQSIFQRVILNFIKFLLPDVYNSTWATNENKLVLSKSYPLEWKPLLEEDQFIIAEMRPESWHPDWQLGRTCFNDAFNYAVSSALVDFDRMNVNETSNTETSDKENIDKGLAYLKQHIWSQARSTLFDLLNRLDNISSLLNFEGTNLKEKMERLYEAVDVLFAKQARVYPSFDVTSEATSKVYQKLQQSLGRQDELLGSDDEEEQKRLVEEWIESVSRVKPQLAHFHTLQLLDRVLNKKPYSAEETRKGNTNLKVIQLPWEPDLTDKTGVNKWIALPFERKQIPTNGKISIVAQVPINFFQTKNKCGFVIDEWVETIPNEIEDTAVAFHYDQPSQEAPNCLLLALPARNDGKWEINNLVGAIDQTIELAKLRMMNYDYLPPKYKYILPALYYPDLQENEQANQD